MTSYYEKNKNHYMKKLKEFAPEQFKAFSRFDGTVFKPGALSKKKRKSLQSPLPMSQNVPIV